MNSAMRTLLGVALAGSVLLVAGCGEDSPPRQTPVARVEMTGTVTGGFVQGPHATVVEASARGRAGRLRTAVGSSPSLQYAVSLVDLEGPYALTALVQYGDTGTRGYTVALAQGRANITPLTTLLVAQLYGQDPATVFQGFTPGGGAEPSRVTAGNLQDAQAKLSAYLQEALDLTIPASVGDFITADFRPVPGDPMFDASAALLARLEERELTLPQFISTVAQTARLCIVEHVRVSMAGQATEFCPQTRSATPADGDEDRLDYEFVDRHGNTLEVQVDGDVVLSARYETHEGISYQCTDSQCAAIALEAVTEDLSRPIGFGQVMLFGDAGSLALDGTLTGAIPGVALPLLPCDINRFFVVFPDRSLVASCVDPDQYGFGIGAYLGDFQGVGPSRVQYQYSVPGEIDPTRPKVTVVTDANDAVLAVQFVDFEPDTYDPRRIYGCRLDACNGITLGEVTENVDALGLPILIRSVAFQKTLLTGYDEYGNETGDSVELIASLNTAYLDWVTGGFMDPIEFPPPGSCGVDYLVVAGTADGTAFDLCLTSTGSALEQPNGDVLLVAGNFETDGLRVLLHDGAIAQATVSISQQLVFICNGGCDGITVSPPDGEGKRTLQFDDPILYESLIGELAGTRSLRLDGGPVVFDAQVPAP